MKILFVTSEASPFASSGGLGDVSGSLPRALRARFVGCRVVLPLYASIASEWREKMTFLTSFSVPVAWRRQYCGVFQITVDGVIYYLLDNEYYFKRAGLYGHYDDAERFAFFSRAALEMLRYIDFRPDILHANDWQTALLPVYFSLFYAREEGFSHLKTLYTIHNIQYQGQYGMEILGDVFGLPEHARSLVEFDGCINLMKGGIEAAHRVNTVSPTYARELLDPWYAHGLAPILRRCEGKLSGILNGIDTVRYDPAADPVLACPFSADNPSGKAADKRALQQSLGLEPLPDQPLIGMVSRLVSHKGLDLVTAILDALLDQPLQFVVLGSGDWVYERFFRQMQEKHADKMRFYEGFVPQVAPTVYAGADLFLMPSKSEPCGLSQMIACRYGAVPIVRQTGGLKDTITDCGDGYGNGFTFQSYDAGDLWRALERALGAYRNQTDWPLLVDRALRSDFSWARSAGAYIRLYKELLSSS